MAFGFIKLECWPYQMEKVRLFVEPSQNSIPALDGRRNERTDGVWVGAAQLQPIHALRLACGAQRALLPVAEGAINIHDVRDRRRQTSDSIIA